jgi:hypothetical protein
MSIEKHGGIISTGELLIRPPELSGNPISNQLVAKQEGPAKEMKLALRSIFVHTSKGCLTWRKILRHGADGFTSRPKESILRMSIGLKNPSPSTRFEPANLGYN